MKCSELLEFVASVFFAIALPVGVLFALNYWYTSTEIPQQIACRQQGLDYTDAYPVMPGVVCVPRVGQAVDTVYVKVAP